MFEKSEKITETSLIKIIDVISTFDADLGGTEIYNPIKIALEFENIKNYPRNIFLLTDGCVSDSISIYDIIKRNTHKGFVHSLGIGDGCSSSFIQDVARFGRGNSELISEESDMSEKVVGLLKSTMKPFLTNFDISFDKNIVDFIIPDPETISMIKINEPLNFFVFLNKNFRDVKETSFKMTYESNPENKKVTENIVCQINDSMMTNDLLHKFGIYKLLKEQEEIELKKIKSDSLESMLKGLQKKEIDLALNYKILTEKTSFICLIKEKTNLNKKITVPVYESDSGGYSNEKIRNLKSILNSAYYQIRNQEEELLTSALEYQHKELHVYKIINDQKQILHSFGGVEKWKLEIMYDITSNELIFSEDPYFQGDWRIILEINRDRLTKHFTFQMIKDSYNTQFFKDG